VSGDSKGNIWYSDYKTRFFGKLDPRTGIITEYSIPLTPGFMTGTHAVIVDQKHGDLVWLSEAWNDKWTKMDSKTGQLTQFNDTPNGNFALAPDGSIWSNKNQAAVRVDPETGKVSNQYPMPGRAAYGVAVSDDGHYWAAGGPSTGGNYGEFLDIRTGRMTLLDMGDHLPGPSRGGFDPFGNAWFGGKNGSLVEIDTKAAKMREFFPPTVYAPYSAFYEAWSDKNGEVWAGLLHGRGMVRYNPRTSRWIEYALPEPYGHDRKTWIDNTTNPVTVWYVDYQGYLVRIQPLE
jgi:streptogramin lyase